MSAVKLWGCHNRVTQKSYWASEMTFTDGKKRRVQQAVEIEDRSSPDCQYRKGTPDDPRCKGCTAP